MPAGRGGGGVSPQLFSRLHHYQVPRVVDPPVQLVVVLLGVAFRSPVAKPLPCEAQGGAWALPAPHWDTQGTAFVRLHYPGAGLCAPRQTVRPWDMSGAWAQPGVGVPPSRGRPGPPAFGYSSWRGRWLEGQGAGRRGHSALGPGSCPRPAHPSALTIVELSRWPQSAGPEIGCLVPRGNKGYRGPPGPSPPQELSLPSQLPWGETGLAGDGEPESLPVCPWPGGHSPTRN